MSEENRQQQSSAESTVAGAAKTGKAIASIAKGAATGGAHGAAVEAAKILKEVDHSHRSRHLASGFDYCHAALGDIRIPVWRWH